MNLDETLNQAFDALGDRLRAELQSAAGEIANAVAAERERVTREAALARPQDEPAAPNASGASLEQTLEAVRGVGAARSLSEVLDTLVGAAAQAASRAAIILVRGTDLRAWRFVGFPTTFDAPDAIAIEWSEAGAIADAAVTGGAVTSSNAPLFAALPESATCAAVPIKVDGIVVAVLYADEGYAPAPDSSWPSRVELLAQFGARCLEAITSFRTAALVQGSPAAVPVSSGQAHNDAPDGDAAAQRYARLLVSEIKLYHEPEVMAGRRARDLATRLGAEIARARELYEQRVPPRGQRPDYFHAELVRTLADGDAALLELA
jgi:hypothetical protein